MHADCKRQTPNLRFSDKQRAAGNRTEVQTEAKGPRMRSSSFFRLLAISVAIAATGSLPGHRVGEVIASRPAAAAAAPQAIAPNADHPVARRAAELMKALATGGEEAKRAFASSGWKLGERDTVETAFRDLGQLGFYLGTDPKIEGIRLNPDGSAAAEVANAYGRKSILNMKVEASPPHRVSILGLDRTPLDVPDKLREPKSVRLATPVVSAPLTFIGGRPLVDVMIGDKGPYRFMLETGANFVSISPRVAAAVTNKLTPLTPDLMWQVEGRELGSTYMLDDLRIGGATLSGLGVMVLPKRPGEDGTLGLPAYRNLLMGMDLANKRMTLKKGSLPAPDGKEIFPLRPLGSLLAVDFRVGDKFVPFEIDTQADNAWFLATELAADWKFDEELVHVGTVITAGGQHRAPSMLGRLSGDLQLGKYEFKKPLIRVRPDPEDLIPPSGIMGVGAFAHLKMVLDQKHRRVRFARSGSPIIAPPPPWRALDFEIFAGRDRTPKVVDLAPGGAAAKAGLKEGDVVVRFGDTPGNEATGKVRVLAQTAKPIVVEVLRDGHPLKVVVRSEVKVK
jgi:hypothetical protein